MSAATPEPTMPDSDIVNSGEPSASSNLAVVAARNQAAVIAKSDEPRRYPSSFVVIRDLSAMSEPTAKALIRAAQAARQQLKAQL